MQKRTAIVIGATGLVGKALTLRLLDDNLYERVKVVGRRSLGLTHPRLEEHLVDMDRLREHPELLHADDLYCCIGSTMKKSGSKAAFRQVDFDIPVNAALAGAGFVQRYYLVSSIGASARSGNFYLHTKGETEEAVLGSGIPTVHILRPSMLLGPRQEKRTGESIGKVLIRLIGPLLFGTLKKYRGIAADTVAHAMVQLAHDPRTGHFIHESDEIEALAGRPVTTEPNFRPDV